MLVDAHKSSGSGVLEPDVCVVGGGPAGLTVADALRGTGIRVLLLESGGLTADPRDARGESVGHPYFRLHTTRIRALAGTSNHWYHLVGFRARPLDPVDFETRPGVPHSGWPFDRSELDRYYPTAQQLCGLGPFDYDEESWRADGAPGPLPLDERVATALFQLSPTDAFQRLGRELLADADTRIALQATVLELVADDDGRRVDHLRVAVAGGAEVIVRPRTTVLACGGIENARLLLLSRRRHDRGLGNAHDLVGRFFMEHLSVRSGDWVPASEGLVARTARYRLHHVRDVGLHAKLTVAQEVMRAEQLLGCAFFVDAMDPARASEATRSFVSLRHTLADRPRPGHVAGHLRNVLTGLPHVAATVRRQLGGPRRDTALQLRAMAEQAPNPDSRVTLGRRRDAHGLPVARLDWRLTELDRRSIRRSLDIVDDAIRSAGLGRLELKLGEERPPADLRGQWHHMGTTRMHRDPRHGVVDEHGRVHGVANLYVAGSSVFPTSGYANPTLTIVALALRLAERLRG